MRVSVVVTVLNEAESLSRMLDSLAAQAHAPDEVVICDGGSTDGTLALLEAETRLPLLVIQRPAANISQGRNAAIEAATGDVIAVADAGVRSSPRWLQTIVAPFKDAGTQAVAGFFLPDPHTVFEMALGATVLPELREINPVRFLPSSRSVAFRKSAWKTVGGYPRVARLLRRPHLRLAATEIRRAVHLHPRGAGVFSATSEPACLFRAILSLRARGWQGGPVAQAPRHPLPDLPGCRAASSPPLGP